MRSARSPGAGRRPEDAGPISSLIPVVARGHRSLALSLLRDVGLSPGQELLLMKLWDNEPRSQVELAASLGVEPPSAAKMLARMERSGLILRERSNTDRRVVFVSLTDHGRALREPVARIWAELEGRTVAGLTPHEQDALVDLLRRVITNVEDR